MALRVCSIEGYLEFETNRYPVPYEYVTDILTLKATEHEIFVYSPELNLIVRHERLQAGAVIILDVKGIHGPRSVRYGLEPVRDQFLALGNDAEAFLTGLTEKQPKNGGFHVRAILRLKETYHSDDIHRGITHACRCHAYNHRAVERILKNKAKPRTLESYRNERAADNLRKALPPIKQRSLQEYSSLLGDNHYDNRPATASLELIQNSLKTLKLSTIAAILDDELARAAQIALPTTDLLERLLTAEADSLIQRRIERRIKESRLPERKLLADFDFDFQKGIDKAQIMELAKLDFIRRKQGLIIASNSGTGKSHIAKALLLLGCRETYRCRYTTASDMLRDLFSGLADDTLPLKMKRYLAPDLLLIDEVGFDRLEQQDPRNACLFHKIIDSRYCKKSTIITSNIDFKELGDYLGDPIITTAMVDRLVQPFHYPEHRRSFLAAPSITIVEQTNRRSSTVIYQTSIRSS